MAQEKVEPSEKREQGVKQIKFQRLPWQWALCLMVLLAIVGMITLPRTNNHDNALQIRPTRPGQTLPDGFFVYQRLDQQGIRIKSITPEEDTLVVRLESPDQRIQAQEALRTILPMGYIVSQCNAVESINWVRKLTRDQEKMG
jgi:hypothetical protein